MLYWGIFTVGYILGVLLTLKVVVQKKEKVKVQKKDYSVILDLVGKEDTSTIFTQLTKINFIPESSTIKIRRRK